MSGESDWMALERNSSHPSMLLSTHGANLNKMLDRLSIDFLLQEWVALRRRGRTPRDAALELAGKVDGPVQGFAIAVQSAIAECFFPEGPFEVHAICVTERSGNTRTSIQTEVRTDEHGLARLSGHKSFVTLGSAATRLLVAAKSVESHDSDVQVKIAVVGSTQPGVTQREIKSEKVPPELSHSEFWFENVLVQSTLAGDAFGAHLKRFRVLEDLFLYLVTCRSIETSAKRMGWASILAVTARELVIDLSAELDQDVLTSTSVLRSTHLLDTADQLFNAVSDSHTSAEAQLGWEKGIALVRVGRKLREHRARNALTSG